MKLLIIAISTVLLMYLRSIMQVLYHTILFVILISIVKLFLNLLSLDKRDNCCILHNDSICIVVNIFMTNDLYYLVVKKYLQVYDFYNIGISSSALDIYKCSELSSDIFIC